LSRPAPSDNREQRRADIVAAALRLLEERGLDGLSLRGVAGALGMHPPGLYWYIEGKQELIDLVAKAILDDGLGDVGSCRRDSSAGRGDGACRIVGRLPRGERRLLDLCAETLRRGARRVRLRGELAAIERRERLARLHDAALFDVERVEPRLHRRRHDDFVGVDDAHENDLARVCPHGGPCGEREDGGRSGEKDSFPLGHAIERSSAGRSRRCRARVEGAHCATGFYSVKLPANVL
jgi:AcrR family transcriptional regulator